MANRDRYWTSVGKLSFVILGAYAIGTSFWCSSLGQAFKTRELERDHRFHEAAESVAALYTKVEGETSGTAERDARIVEAKAEFAALTVQIEKESNADFKGTDAMLYSAIGAVPLMGIYFFGAWIVRRVGRSQSALSPAIQ